LIPRCRVCCLEEGVKASVGIGVDSGVGVDRGDGVDNGTGVGVSRNFGELVTFFAKVQKVVGPFKNRNSVGLSGVDALVNTTISWSSCVRSLICPFLINLAMPSLSCCDDKLITWLKVSSESKYTAPTINVSAKAGADVINNARKRVLVSTNVATGSDFIWVNLAKAASIMRFTCITFSKIKGYRKSANVKDRSVILLSGAMVTIFITNSWLP
jgi:hypothetical protein